MIRQILSYLRFFIRSKNQHGVHSPFVYDIITQCFYDKSNHPEYKKIKAYRKQLRSDKTILQVTDLGSGSRVMKSSSRQVGTIAKVNGSRPFLSRLLFRLVRYFKAGKILELGTSLGIGTHAMLLANPNAKITSVEGCPNISRFAADKLSADDNENLQIINSDFDNFLENQTSDSYDLIFIDGNHLKEPTLRYFNLLLNRIHNNSIMIFDDIHWSSEMEEAWAIICEHSRVKISIDIFYWGLVFFREEQAKEHFNIRL